MEQPIKAVVRAGDKIYIHGPATVEHLWLEPRKWWQFWKPRMVEKYVKIDYTG